MKENGKCISDKKQIRFILTQNGITIPVHLIFSECSDELWLCMESMHSTFFNIVFATVCAIFIDPVEMHKSVIEKGIGFR